jgi:aspartate/methionine/tyrosine aminotransferase
MNPIAKQLNQVIENDSPHLTEMMSGVGRSLFFPKGILTQSAEAKEKAHRFNATVGIATEKGGAMHFASIMNSIKEITPESSLTYAPSFGLPALRKAWHEELLRKNPSLESQRTSLPIVTSGVTHALSIFADIWVDPGDVMILPEMMWGNYNLIFGVRKGARMSHYTLFSENGGFNLSAFEETVKKEARQNSKIIVLLNFPQNPSGYTISSEEGAGITDILTRVAEGGTNVIAVTDDSYFGLFYEDNIMKESIFTLLSGRHSRLLAVKLDGATKENFVWGLRVGFITYGCCVKEDPGPIYDALERKTAGGIRGNISNASHLSQSMVLKSMQDKNYLAEKQEKFEVLKSRANRVKQVLADPKFHPAWDVYPFNSGYFMCIRLKGVDAETLRLHLLDKYGIGLISLGEKNIRIAFSCVEEENIEELFDTILKGVQDLS